jgi:thiamine biosynthesis lipoprotein
MNVRVHLVLLLSLLLVAACDSEETLRTYALSGNTMGTTFNITLVTPPADADLEKLHTAILEKLEHIENIASTYRPESELSVFNANPSTDRIKVTPEFCQMVSDALAVSATTNGAFDITVGPLVNLWGFGPTTQDDNLPSDDEVTAARTNVGYQMLGSNCDQGELQKMSAGVYVDLSGWAKGYAVDKIAALLDSEKIENYLVEIGGELRARGHNSEAKKFAIAIEKPLKNNDMNHTVVRLSDVAIATSGDYRNFYEHDGQRYSHTIDPRTGRPVKHNLTGVTVVTESTAYADAMATALLVLGPEDGHALAEQLGLASYFLVRTEHGVEELSTSQFAQLRQQ